MVENIKLSSRAKQVLKYLQSVDGQDVTGEDIANALNINTRQVNGVLTAGLCRYKGKGNILWALIERVPAEIELPDGTHKAIKLVRLTEDGRNFKIADDEEVA